MTISVDINLDTPIYQLTPRQLFQMQQEYMAMQEPKVEKKKEEVKAGVPKYLNSIDDLAKFLGCSKSTIYNMKSEGVLDDAISQYGRWMVFDVEKIIEKFKLSNKYATKKSW